MARYDHLPIYRSAFDLAVHLEKIVRHFNRYHKYTLGTELRACSRRALQLVIEANSQRGPARRDTLLRLRRDLEWFKVLARLCHESGGFAGTRAYLHVSEQIVSLAKQNEGWLKQTGVSAPPVDAAPEQFHEDEDNGNEPELLFCPAE